ncbi:hypothetical protein GCM10027174_07700 [Salinifilum aidingensis]
MTDADQRRVRKILQGLEFPVNKESLLEYAETREADPKTMRALQGLDDREYTSTEDVVASVPQRPEQEIS